MTDGLNETQTRILTWVIYALMALLTAATSYLIVENARMSERYVRLERYKSDTSEIKSSFCRLESKMDVFSNRIEDKIDTLILKVAE